MRILVSIVVVAALTACDPKTNPVDGAQFVTEPKAVAITPGQIDEASGMVASRSMPGNMWVQQDSGNPTDIALLNQDGTVKGKMSLPAPVDNRDWEDMGIGPGPQDGTNYIYLADTGDNNLQYPFYLIYRFPEPKSLTEPIIKAERMFLNTRMALMMRRQSLLTRRPKISGLLQNGRRKSGCTGLPIPRISTM